AHAPGPCTLSLHDALPILMTTLNKPIERLGEIASLVERLLAIDEATMYERPATTRATIERAATALEALQREIAELREQVEVANFAARNGESLASDAIHEIRELLKAHDVPVATFIDDHVRNAIVQRNQERDRAEDLTRQLAEAKRFIEMALDYEGDVFGRHHNDVVDLLTAGGGDE